MTMNVAKSLIKIKLAVTSLIVLSVLFTSFPVRANGFFTLSLVTPAEEGAQSWHSGWPLEFKIEPISPDNYCLAHLGPSRLPTVGTQVAMVYKGDVQNCTDFPHYWRRRDASSNIPGGLKAVEFTPDSDQVGVLDSAGRQVVRNRIEDFSNYPTFSFDGQSTLVGPILYPPANELPRSASDSVRDGIGYGANDDLPGLVIISDVGPGVLFESDLGLAGDVTLREKTPAQRRNLAGLFTDVNFVHKPRTESSPEQVSYISTRMNVPSGLFEPIILWDPCYENADARATPFRRSHPDWSFDGPLGRSCNDGQGGVRAVLVEDSGNDSINSVIQAWPNYPDKSQYNQPYPHQMTVTLRAVLVNGDAPDIINDCNGDGVVSVSDLKVKCNGWQTLISNEIYFRITIRNSYIHCGGFQEDIVYVDFDGNGYEFGEKDDCPIDEPEYIDPQ